MRHLLQPRVLNTASIAAALTTLACYPQLSLWHNRILPVWYLESALFISSIVLWSFVLAWHVPYSHRPIFSKLEPSPFAAATVIGLGTAAAYHFWLDPSLRSKLPEEYPPDFRHWLASLLFVLTFQQLVLVFAPFDWLLRLLRNRWLAASLLAMLGAALFAYQARPFAASFGPLPLEVWLAGRVLAGVLVAVLYWRGGVFLVSWWSLLLQCRFLLDYVGHPGPVMP